MKISQREFAYRKILDAIISGDLKPGEKLVEQKLCEAFQIGRTPVREALHELEIQGYVTFFPNRGMNVSTMSVLDIEEVYNILALLESHAVEIAVKHFNTVDERKLRSILNDYAKSWQARKFRDVVNKNKEFHEYFVRHSGNENLKRIITNMRNRLFRSVFIATTLPGNFERTTTQHEAIVNAAFNNGPGQAAKLMRRHLIEASKALVEFLKQSPGL